MALNKTLSFDLELKPGGIPPIVHASQGDIGRMFKANIYWDGSAATSYISGATVNLRGRKPDKTVFDYTATLAGSTVTFETTEQMTIISGPVECELVFSNDGDVIASANFVLIVEESPYNPEAPSESVIPGIEDIVTDVVDDVIGDNVGDWLDEHPEATTTVQDGAITKAKINTAFLPEIENAYVTPEQFGAVGDGTTDDTAAVQAAIASGSTVLFVKEYLISVPLELNGNQALLSKGGAIKKAETARDFPIFYGSNISNIVIDGFYLDGLKHWTGVTTSGVYNDVGVKLSNCDNVRITNTHFKDFGAEAVDITGTNAKISRNTIEYTGVFTGSLPNYNFGISYDLTDSVLDDNSIVGTVHGFNSGLTNKNNILSNNIIKTASNGQHGFYMEACENVNVVGNVIDAAICGVKFQRNDDSLSVFENGLICNNQIKAKTHGVLITDLRADSGYNKHFIINDNLIESKDRGVEIESTDDVIIQNNKIINYSTQTGYVCRLSNCNLIKIVGNNLFGDRYGVYFLDDPSATLPHYYSNICIAENYINMKNTSAGSAIRIPSGKNFVISNNVFEYEGTNTSTDGLYITLSNSSDLSGVVVAGNISTGFRWGIRGVGSPVLTQSGNLFNTSTGV